VSRHILTPREHKLIIGVVQGRRASAPSSSRSRTCASTARRSSTCSHFTNDGVRVPPAGRRSDPLHRRPGALPLLPPTLHIDNGKTSGRRPGEGLHRQAVPEAVHGRPASVHNDGPRPAGLLLDNTRRTWRATGSCRTASVGIGDPSPQGDPRQDAGDHRGGGRAGARSSVRTPPTPTRRGLEYENAILSTSLPGPRRRGRRGCKGRRRRRGRA
jgi:hypothetical protein